MSNTSDTATQRPLEWIVSYLDDLIRTELAEADLPRFTADEHVDRDTIWFWELPDNAGVVLSAVTNLEMPVAKVFKPGDLDGVAPDGWETCTEEFIFF